MLLTYDVFVTVTGVGVGSDGVGSFTDEQISLVKVLVLWVGLTYVF